MADVMRVVNANLVRLFPEHVKGASEEQWDTLSPLSPAVPDGTDRWVYGEIVGMFAKFWPAFSGVDDTLTLLYNSPQFYILDNMFVKRMQEVINSFAPNMPWQQ